MRWTYDELLELPADVYDVLVEEVAAANRDREGAGGDLDDLG
jgi:hypothetical protein